MGAFQGPPGTRPVSAPRSSRIRKSTVVRNSRARGPPRGNVCSMRMSQPAFSVKCSASKLPPPALRAGRSGLLLLVLRKLRTKSISPPLLGIYKCCSLFLPSVGRDSKRNVYVGPRCSGDLRLTGDAVLVIFRSVPPLQMTKTAWLRGLTASQPSLPAKSSCVAPCLQSRLPLRLQSTAPHPAKPKSPPPARPLRITGVADYLDTSLGASAGKTVILRKTRIPSRACRAVPACLLTISASLPPLLTQSRKPV